MEMTHTVHGVRQGRDLSERMLVDSYCALRSGETPDRAYYDRDDQFDTSMAAAVVLDESSSMGGLLKDATRMLMAITEPLDSLGVKTQVSGFRNGNYGDYDSYRGPRDGYGKEYHRYHGVRNDVFKGFDERFQSVKWRFANTIAEGSTPMADGIQFALDALNTRREAYRVLFVITDGCPDGGHEPVIRRQIRLAKEAGIHVIGVGIGSGACYVTDLFPDYVYGEASELPKQLVAKMNNLLDARSAGKRGRKMRRTG
jgi:nitric oxide reductase activation protein